MATINNITSQAVQSAVIVVNNGAQLRAINVENNAASERWLQVFDGYQAPSANAIPIYEVKLDSGEQKSIDFSVIGWIIMSVGIVVASSSTSGLYTDSGSTDLFVTVIWD